MSCGIFRIVFNKTLVSPGWASLVAQWVKNLLTMQETWVQSLGPEDPLEKGMQPTPVSLPGELHGQRSLAGYSSRGRKKSDTAEPLTHTHITWLVFKVGLDPIRHISIENISMYFFRSKNIT